MVPDVRIVINHGRVVVDRIFGISKENILGVILFVGRTGGSHVCPGAHQDELLRTAHAVIPQVHGKRKRKTAAGGVSRHNDFLREVIPLLNEKLPGADSILQCSGIGMFRGIAVIYDQAGLTVVTVAVENAEVAVDIPKTRNIAAAV